jgi:hypothetical protein
MIFNVSLTGFQTWIGYEDVKSLKTSFCVRKYSNGFAQPSIPIPFDVENLNVGGAMNLTSGKFTTPRAGTYFFSASGPVSFSKTYSSLHCDMHIYKNGETIGYSPTVSYSSAGDFKTFTIQVTVSLQTGDEIWLAITSPISSGVSLYGYRALHFTGFLLEEALF